VEAVSPARKTIDTGMENRHDHRIKPDHHRQKSMKNPHREQHALRSAVRHVSLKHDRHTIKPALENQRYYVGWYNDRRKTLKPPLPIVYGLLDPFPKTIGNHC